MKTGGRLQNAQVALLLSSRSEMQRVIELARQRSMAAQGLAPPPTTAIAPLPQPMPPMPPRPPVQQPAPQPAPVAPPAAEPEIVEIKSVSTGITGHEWRPGRMHGDVCSRPVFD